VIVLEINTVGNKVKRRIFDRIVSQIFYQANDQVAWKIANHVRRQIDFQVRHRVKSQISMHVPNISEGSITEPINVQVREMLN